MKRFYIPILFLFAVSILTAVTASGKTPEDIVREAREQVKEVSLKEAKKIIDSGEKVVILDVRDKEEFEKEHIKGAINVSRGLLEFIVQNKIPDKNTTIIVY